MYVAGSGSRYDFHSDPVLAVLTTKKLKHFISRKISILSSGKIVFKDPDPEPKKGRQESKLKQFGSAALAVN